MSHQTPPAADPTSAAPGPGPEQGDPTVTGAEHRVHRGLTYATVPGFRPLVLDLHLPEAARLPAPVVVFVHGGGWLAGSREAVGPAFADWSPSPFAQLTAHGVAVASVDYRLSAEATWPAPLEDVVAGLRWLREHGAAWGLDPTRMALWGESAGAHLAAIAGLLGADDRRGAGPVRAVVDWYGPTDLRSMASQLRPDAPADPDATDSRESRLLGAAVQTVPELAADASPIHHVTAGAPAFLLLHGRDDRFVPTAQSELLVAALRAHGVPARLELLDGADHLWMGSERAPARAFDLTVGFLQEHLA